MTVGMPPDHSPCSRTERLRGLCHYTSVGTRLYGHPSPLYTLPLLHLQNANPRLLLISLSEESLCSCKSLSKFAMQKEGAICHRRTCNDSCKRDGASVSKNCHSLLQVWRSQIYMTR
ncbi:hypothetical protein AVEN_244008-1 [Araneus ventricosus]|uniref:Uncharacterized protein n=1 Tax=Araneus ventricosus TaxID=182803 RepID=A0A4Y2I3X8_ARAVE|nr:hypothetical protein AVEN_244008-1 [Araneus ventricosus]